MSKNEKVQVVSTAEDVDALPVGSVIRDEQTYVYERFDDPRAKPWRTPGWGDDFASHEIVVPAQVLYVPEEAS